MSATSALADAALRAAIAERASYRLCLCAALDQLHAAQNEIARLEEIVQQQRALWARCARQVFGPQGPSDAA